MDKRILDVVNDFAAWRGNSFTLAALIVAVHLEIVRERLIAAGFEDATGAL